MSLIFSPIVLFFRTILPSVLNGIVIWGSCSQSFLSQQLFAAANVAQRRTNCKTHFTTSLRIQPSLLAVIHYCNFGHIVIIAPAPSLMKLLKTQNRTYILGNIISYSCNTCHKFGEVPSIIMIFYFNPSLLSNEVRKSLSSGVTGI